MDLIQKKNIGGIKEGNSIKKIANTHQLKYSQALNLYKELMQKGIITQIDVEEGKKRQTV